MIKEDPATTTAVRRTVI